MYSLASFGHASKKNDRLRLVTARQPYKKPGSKARSALNPRSDSPPPKLLRCGVNPTTAKLLEITYLLEELLGVVFPGVLESKLSDLLEEGALESVLLPVLMPPGVNAPPVAELLPDKPKYEKTLWRQLA